MAVRDVYITTVVGGVPILNVPSDSGEDLIIHRIRQGFGTQIDGADHKYTDKGEDAADRAYSSYIVAALLSRMEKNPLASIVLIDLMMMPTHVGHLAVLLKYDVTAEEFIRLAQYVYGSQLQLLADGLKDRSILPWLLMVRWKRL